MNSPIFTIAILAALEVRIRVALASKNVTGSMEAQNEKEITMRYESDPKEQAMELGAFSVSLAVKDLQASKAFYEKFGFTVFAGEASQNWLIMKNGEHAIGLFQDMFEKNTLTFNPGWDSNAGKLDTFTDVRDLQRQLKADGVHFIAEADEATTGPAHFAVLDPDGNSILVDQHV